MADVKAELGISKKRLEQELAEARARIEQLEVDVRVKDEQLQRSNGDMNSLRSQLAVREQAMTVALAKYDCARDILRDLFGDAVKRTMIAR